MRLHGAGGAGKKGGIGLHRFRADFDTGAYFKKPNRRTIDLHATVPCRGSGPARLRWPGFMASVAGARSPNRFGNLRGTSIGLSPRHRRSQVTRALPERIIRPRDRAQRT